MHACIDKPARFAYQFTSKKVPFSQHNRKLVSLLACPVLADGAIGSHGEKERERDKKKEEDKHSYSTQRVKTI